MSDLKGQHIIVTRARHQSEGLVDKIEQLGGIAVEYPCIDIAPPDDLDLLDSVLAEINSYNWLIFTSRNAVQMVAQRLQILGLAIDWSQVKVGAVGTKTDALIQELLGKPADFIPENHTAHDLAHNVPIYPYETVLLPQSSLADTDVYDILLGERQADVTLVTAYQTVIGQGGNDVPTMLQKGQIDAITFTSPSTVENFLKRIAPLTAAEMLAVCIGTTTAESALGNGFLNVRYPRDHTLEHLVDLLVQLLAEVDYDKA